MNIPKLHFTERTDIHFDMEAWLKLMCELLYECDEAIVDEAMDEAA